MQSAVDKRPPHKSSQVRKNTNSDKETQDNREKELRGNTMEENTRKWKKIQGNGRE